MKHLKLLLIPFFFISCSGSKTLLKSLNKHQASLDYLYDSKINDCDKSSNIKFINLNNIALDSLTSVSKINHKILPLIVYNHEELNLGVKLGQNSIKQNYTDFFEKAFTVESNRTGCYSLSKNTKNTEYTLEITCDTCNISSKYQHKGTILFLFFAYSIQFQEIGFPAETKLALNVKLSKGNNLIFEQKYSIDKSQGFINKQLQNRFRYSDLITNMTESLSMSTKECIEQIIYDINQEIDKQ